METRWLEDFMVLAESGSFTRSAQARHLTQPAFSRRIKALESWVGCDLIDRSSYPTRLTPAGEVFKGQAVAMLTQIHATRALLQGMRPLPEETMEFAVPHTLSFAFFPKWLTQVESGFGPLSCRLQASNVHDALLSFVEGGSDLLMCYHHPKQPVELANERYTGLILGIERLRPYSRCDSNGQALFRLPGSERAPLPFLGFASNAYFRLMTELIMENAPEHCHMMQRYETDMAEGLKYMVLEGHGVAFLPDSIVARELHAGEVVLAASDDERWSVEMEIRLYRDLKHGRPALNAFWDYLKTIYPQV